jgi:hypothetical protein
MIIKYFYKEKKMNQTEMVMELFDLHVRRLANGNKLSVVFESTEDLELEKKLIEFRGENVRVTLTQEHEPENKSDRVFIDGNFEVFDLKCRRLRNGDKLRLVIECLYEKNQELELVKLRYDNVKVFMEKVGELPFDQDDEDIDIKDPEA